MSARQATHDNMAHAYLVLHIYLSISVCVTVQLTITGPGE